VDCLAEVVVPAQSNGRFDGGVQAGDQSASAIESLAKFCRVGPGNFTPSRLVPPREGCRLPLNTGFLPLPVDPSQMAMTASFAPRA
jgi:hypothetical protein